MCKKTEISETNKIGTCLLTQAGNVGKHRKSNIQLNAVRIKCYIM